MREPHLPTHEPAGTSASPQDRTSAFRNDETSASPQGVSGNDVSDLFLERYLLGELKPVDRAALAKRLANDSALRERLESLRRDNEAFARTHDAGILAHGVRERARREQVHARIKAGTARAGSRNFPGFAGWKPALGGVFLLALVAVPAWRVLNGESSSIVRAATEVPTDVATGSGQEPLPAERTETKEPAGTGFAAAPKTDNAAAKPAPAAAPSSRTEAPPPSGQIAGAAHDVTRLKGLEPTLALFRRTQTGAEPLKPGASVKPGDVLRVGYRSAGRSFGAIFSVDGHGNVTRHWPLTGDRAARLAAGETLLPGAFELDDAPSYERFYLLVSERAFNLKPLLESLHVSKTPAENGVEIVRFDLLKENGI